MFVCLLRIHVLNTFSKGYSGQRSKMYNISEMYAQHASGNHTQIHIKL
jgi:hypothetical protein